MTQKRTALDVVQDIRKGCRTERGEDVDLARELDALMGRPDFIAFLQTIDVPKLGHPPVHVEKFPK